MIVDQEKIKKEMDHSLREWGVDPSRLYSRVQRMKHTSFRDLAGATAVEYALGSSTMARPEDHPLIKCADSICEENIVFPKDSNSAVKYLLEDMLNDVVEENEKVYTNIAEDKIGMHYAPYFLHRSGNYYRRPDFRHFSDDELDPLKRFTKRQLLPQEYLHLMWSDEDSLSGNIFEALVSSYVIYNKPCHHCSSADAIRWNGGFGQSSSWAGLVCLYCYSTYEIKSKRNMDKIEKGFRYGFQGSSYRTFHKYPPISNASRYLVVVSRTPSSTLGSYGHQVVIAKIEEVTPRLSSLSFIDMKCTDRDMHIGSEIKADLSSRRDWCIVPPCSLDSTEMAKELFDHHFGEGEWSRMEKSNKTATRATQAPTTSPFARPEADMTHLQDSFRGLRLRDTGQTTRESRRHNTYASTARSQTVTLPSRYDWAFDDVIPASRMSSRHSGKGGRRHRR